MVVERVVKTVSYSRYKILNIMVQNSAGKKASFLRFSSAINFNEWRPWTDNQDIMGAMKLSSSTFTKSPTLPWLPKCYSNVKMPPRRRFINLKWVHLILIKQRLFFFLKLWMTDPLKLTSHGILLLVCYYTRYTRYHTIL